MGGMERRVDLGDGRGFLREAPAKSIARIDRALGHRMQISEAERSWGKQNEYWVAYQRYLVGGPWAAIALHPDTPSVHQLAYAIDSDEAQAHLALMAEHGWVRTVYRDGKLVEPWHFEYVESKDQHRHETVTLTQGTDGVWRISEEDDMSAEAEKKIDAIYAAVFGARNLTGKDDPIAWQNKGGSVQKANYGILPIVIHNQSLIAAQSGRIAAMEEVVEQLAKGSGAVLDMTAIQRAAEAGARTALSGLVLTADVPG